MKASAQPVVLRNFRQTVYNGLYKVTDEISGYMPVYMKQECMKQGGKQGVAREMRLEYDATLECWSSAPATSEYRSLNPSSKSDRESVNKKYRHPFVKCSFGVLPDKQAIPWCICRGIEKKFVVVGDDCMCAKELKGKDKKPECVPVLLIYLIYFSNGTTSHP